MEQLPALGTAISEVIQPTFQAYAPLLLKQASQIRSTVCNTYAYGPHERQKLDVYTPSARAKQITDNENSVFIFLYGGGFVRGDRSLKFFHDGLVYANLGHYFAENTGFEIVIVDYRLLSHGAKFPSGGEDISLAIDWILQRSAADPHKPLDIYMMGNSAGGVHLSTYLLAPDFAAHRRQIISEGSSNAQLKAVILLSVPLHFEQGHESRGDILQAYFGSHIQKDCPLGLLKAARQDGSIIQLRQLYVLVLQGELDPEDEVLVPTAEFVTEWRGEELIKRNLTLQTMNGHNHASPVLAVGTSVPAEEAWAQQVIKFIAQSSEKSQ